jgi:thiol reductant ABC exporter CydD subunit
MAPVSGVDRRLLRWARPARVHLAASVGLGTARGLLLVAQAWLIATIVAAAFIGGRDVHALRGRMLALGAVVVLRALVAWATELSADRCSARVKSMMRSGLAATAASGTAAAPAADRAGDVVTLATQGIDALDSYFSRYLPQLLIAVIVPCAVIVAVASVDWVSAVILALTLPLIPVFMALVGLGTRRHADRQFHALQVLSSHFLDVVTGMTTLRVFGRAKAQVRAVGEVTDAYRRRVMGTLRRAFLSSLVLELVASVSVALIAVGIGIRLLGGHLGLRTALFVLVLAPEAYLPLRQVAAEYHASAAGTSAAAQVFARLDERPPARPAGVAMPDPAAADVVVEDVSFCYPGRDQPAPWRASLVVHPGEVLAVTGPSGSGKSTLIAILLGMLQPTEGTVHVGGVDLTRLDPDEWRSRIAWVPQRPYLFAGTLADNIRVGKRTATTADLLQAATAAGLAPLLARLPHGLATELGDLGAGLSAGERQRVALARAFVRDARLLLLDEPTANLDGRTEAEVLGAVERLAVGRTVLVVAHRPALLAFADRVVELQPAGVTV